MFYLPNQVRGGISCFRVTDAGDARFAVYRQSMGFSHASIYEREFRKSLWMTYVLTAPDIAWGNIPDPRFHYMLPSGESPPLVVFERVSQ